MGLVCFIYKNINGVIVADQGVLAYRQSLINLVGVLKPQIS